MATTDGYVQITPDSTGKKIDNSEVTRTDGTVVERQRINLSDPSDKNAHAAVLLRDPLVDDYDIVVDSHSLNVITNLLSQMLQEFREFRALIQSKM